MIKTGARAATPKPETPPVVVSPKVAAEPKAAPPLMGKVPEDAFKVRPAPASTLEVFPDVVQGSEEWHAQRRGLVTASVVHLLITAAKLDVASNETSKGLTRMLAAERITGFTEPTHTSADMERGKFDEPIARDLYSEHHASAHQVGFMVRDFEGVQIGYSPDGLVGDDGLIEIKSRAQKKHLDTILDDQVPPENMAQIQSGLLVSGRAWCDYVSYCGGMRLWVKRVFPDPRWFEAILKAATAFEKLAAEYIATYEERTVGMPETERVEHYEEMEF